jgi:hypothetical protein
MTGNGFRCPVDASHGKLLDWPTARFGWFCPHQSHDGWKDRPRTRAFFRTAEAESGLVQESPTR